MVNTRVRSHVSAIGPHSLRPIKGRAYERVCMCLCVCVCACVHNNNNSNNNNNNIVCEQNVCARFIRFVRRLLLSISLGLTSWLLRSRFRFGCARASTRQRHRRRRRRRYRHTSANPMEQPPQQTGADGVKCDPMRCDARCETNAETTTTTTTMTCRRVRSWFDRCTWY